MTRHYFDEDYVPTRTDVDSVDDTDEFYTYSNGIFDPSDKDTDGGIYDDYWCNKEYYDRVDSNDPIRWEQLKIGKSLLLVCSTGLIRRMGDPFWCVTKGVPLTGTPYSYVMVETEDNVYKRYFIHHLVWKAFQGDVPIGWEVRHKPSVPMEYTREYPNELGLLDIYPVIPSSSTSSSL